MNEQNKRRINIALRLFGYVGTGFMIFALFDALDYMLGGGGTSIAGHLLQRAYFIFLWGGYYPSGYNVVIFSAFYFLFYKKFRWRAIYMFIFVWGAEDLLFNIENSIVNLVVFHGAGFFYGDPLHFFMIIGADALAAVIGWKMLHPRLNFGFGMTKYIGLTFLIVATGYTELLGLQGYIGFNVLPNFLDAVSNIGFMAFLYSIVTLRDEKP